MVTVGALNAQKEAEGVGRVCKWVGAAGGVVGGSLVGALSGSAAGVPGAIAGGIAGGAAGAQMGLKGGEVAEKSVLDHYNVHTNICRWCMTRFETTKDETEEDHDLCQRCRRKRELGYRDAGSTATMMRNMNNATSATIGGEGPLRPPPGTRPPSQPLQQRPSVPARPPPSSSQQSLQPQSGPPSKRLVPPGSDLKRGKWIVGQACEVLSSSGSWKLAMIKEIGDKYAKVVYGDGSGEKQVIWSHIRPLPDTAG